MSSGNRILYLDSSRGLAALIVFIGHFRLFFTANSDTDWLFRTPFALLFDANAAVMYFFILSGFVLTRSIRNQQMKTIGEYGVFVLKRVFRIYPAFIIALIVTFIIVDTAQDFPFRFHTFWINAPFDPFSVFTQAILIKRLPNDPVFRILPHDWTLSIEIAASLLLPAMAIIARINSLLLLVSIYCAIKFLNLDPFIFDFTLGVFLATQYNSLHALNAKKPALIAALTILAVTYLFPAFTAVADHIAIHLKSLSLIILLYLLLESTISQKVLSSRPLLFLGKISYSFYLIHIGIMLIFSRLINVVDATILFALVFTSTILYSVFSYHVIEKTSIHAANSLIRGNGKH